MTINRPVTMVDVAQRAKVSRSAVSAAISGKASTAMISDETRKRILVAAEELGYRPNILSRAFKQQQSFLIGLLGRECYFVFMLETLCGIEEILDQRDYSVLAFYRGSWADDQAKHLQRSQDRRVDGMIIVPSPEHPDGENHRTIRKLREQGMPVVQIYRKIYPDVPVVMVNETRIGYLATQHLIELGHKRIVHVTHHGYLDQELPGTNTDALQRYQGYVQAMEEAGLEAHVIAFQRPAFNGGADEYQQYRNHAVLTPAVKAILAEMSLNPDKRLNKNEASIAASRLASQHYTGVTTFSDYTAIALMHELMAQGIRVPDDVSIVGFDGVEMGVAVQPALTTLKPPLIDIGRTAAQMVLEMMEGHPGKDVFFEPQLILRKSTKRA